MSYRLQTQNANMVRYADPDAFFNTVTLKISVQPKKAGARTVYNASSAINIERTVNLPVPVNCADPCIVTDQEKLALRFSLSGSTQSKIAVGQMIDDFISVLSQKRNDLVSGFLPTDASLDFLFVTNP